MLYSKIGFDVRKKRVIYVGFSRNMDNTSKDLKLPSKDQRWEPIRKSNSTMNMENWDQNNGRKVLWRKKMVGRKETNRRKKMWIDIHPLAVLNYKFCLRKIR